MFDLLMCTVVFILGILLGGGLLWAMLVIEAEKCRKKQRRWR